LSPREEGTENLPQITLRPVIREKEDSEDEEDKKKHEEKLSQPVVQQVAEEDALDLTAKKNGTEARLEKISQKIALRRQVSLRSVVAAQEAATSTALVPEEDAKLRPAGKKGAEVKQCTNCGQSGEMKQCGVCGDMGMCGVCSMCYICGRVSGFCERPEVHARPGMYGMSGMPSLSGLSAEELGGFEPGSEATAKKKKKKKKRKGSDNSTSSGLEVVEKPKASPKEGASSEDEAELGLYWVDNKEYKAPSAGMAFRYTKNLADPVKDFRKFAAWGTTVTGSDQGDGWLKVGKFFLPFHLAGKRVLTFKASADDAKGAPRKKQRPATAASPLADGESPT